MVCLLGNIENRLTVRTAFDATDLSETGDVSRSIAFVRVDMDLAVSSTRALDATHDVEWYVTVPVGSSFPTTFAFRSLSSGGAQDMYVLALVTQKGGSGKSTLAVGLAVAAMENGERVAFVEADPQGTISKWKEQRGTPLSARRSGRRPHRNRAGAIALRG
jgi:Mrp family chromosome partitioning ATPase